MDLRYVLNVFHSNSSSAFVRRRDAHVFQPFQQTKTTCLFSLAHPTTRQCAPLARVMHIRHPDQLERGNSMAKKSQWLWILGCVFMLTIACGNSDDDPSNGGEEGVTETVGGADNDGNFTSTNGNGSDASAGDENASSSGNKTAPPHENPDPGQSGGGQPGPDPNPGPCTPLTCDSEGAGCGEQEDGCGGTISCVCSSPPPPPDPCVPLTCSSNDAMCGEQEDGCGGTITCDCAVPDPCQPLPVAPDTCGVIDDGCGGTLDLGGCDNGDVCDASTNKCICQPQTCHTMNAFCGPVPDGCGGWLNCGGCDGGFACNSKTFACECTPRTCESFGLTCGRITDGCGGTIDCGPPCKPSCVIEPDTISVVGNVDGLLVDQTGTPSTVNLVQKSDQSALAASSKEWRVQFVWEGFANNNERISVGDGGIWLGPNDTLYCIRQAELVLLRDGGFHFSITAVSPWDEGLRQCSHILLRVQLDGCGQG